METARIAGACLRGADAEIVTVEGRFVPDDRGGTDVALSGLPDAVVRDGKARLLCALSEARLAPGPGRLFLNLVPAGQRKRGELLDLPLALAAATAAGHLEPSRAAGVLFLGELGIDGRLHDVPGALAAAEAARRAGLRRVVAPPRGAAEAAHLPDLRVFEANDLSEAVSALWANDDEAVKVGAQDGAGARQRGRYRLDGIRGQPLAKHAATVAAAGGHALLLIGPPGTGKSLVARALLELLPPPTLEERIEITRVQSAVGLWPGGLAVDRPFRAPHHTVSFAGLVGGGSPPRAGEITLAHGGLLFLDELGEFKRESLEALRQPLEEGRVLVSRAADRVDLPARFQLVAAMNPCPCGYRGHPSVRCRDTPGTVQRYRERLSGPLLDRLDLRVELATPSFDALTGTGTEAGTEAGTGTGTGAEAEGSSDPGDGGRSPSSGAAVAEAVVAARERSLARQGAVSNGRLDAQALDRWSPLGGRGRALLERASHHRGLSARAVQSMRRVARTLADLDGAERVDEEHVAQALALRAPLF